MKVLLVNPPIRLSSPPYFPPLGLASIAACLQRNNHVIRMLDLNAIRSDQVMHPVKDLGLIGVSGLISTYRHIEGIISTLRTAHPDVPIVIGGGGFSSAPEIYMNEFRPDFGIVGEGEEAMLELADGNSPETIDGLWYWRGDEIVSNPNRKPIKDLDSLPPTPFGLLEMQAYIRGSKYYPWRGFAALATRGCPFGCNFCYKLFGRSIRYRSVDSVARELETLSKDYFVEGILFGDECLTTRKSYVLELCEAIKPLSLKWVHYSRLDTLDEEMMKAMVDAGCEAVGFGLESGSQRILDAMGKRINLEEAKETILMARRYFKGVGTSMIFGYPGEDDDSLNETLEYLKPIGYKGAVFFLTPYPGTQVYDEHKDTIIKQIGSLPEFFRRLGDAGEFVVNLTDWTDEEYMTKRQDFIERLA